MNRGFRRKMKSSLQSEPESPAQAPARRSFWRQITTRRFLFISIVVHVLFGVVASVFIVQTIQAKRKQTFAGAPASPNAPTHAIEHKVQMQKKQQTMSAPAALKRITTTAINTKVALPEMPAMPALSSHITPVQMAGMGGVGTGLTMGGGGGGGSGGSGGGIALFGLRAKSDSALVGAFYDFKQTPTGQPTSMEIKDERMLSAPERPANDEDFKLVGRFANGGFNEGILSQYFKGPVPLYTTQIFIPIGPSEDGPTEFNLGGKVRGRRWVAIYRGKVSPVEEGRYHFVGAADDYLIVRFRDQIVLDGSLSRPTGKKPAKVFNFDGMTGSMKCIEGDPFNVDPGEFYDIQILIGEQPGGETGAFLLLEKDGAEYAKDSKGNPILPIFKMAPSNTDRSGRGAPVTSADTSWSVWKAQKP